MRWRAWSFALVIVVGVVGGLFLWAAPSGAQGPGRAGEAAVPAVEGPLAEVRRAMYAGREWEVLGRGLGQDRLVVPTVLTSLPQSFVRATRMVFEWDRDRNWEIYLANSDMKNLVRLTNHPANDVYPQLSPGAGQVAFSSDRDNGTFQVFVMNVDGTNLRQLTRIGNNLRPKWSPDGTKLVYQSDRDGNWEIYIIDVNGTEERRLTASPSYDGMPVWSPDGKWIAFISDRAYGIPSVWIMRPDGSEPHRIGPLIPSVFPVWGSNGERIYFGGAKNASEKFDLRLVVLKTRRERVLLYCSTYGRDCWPGGTVGEFLLFSEIGYEWVGSGFKPTMAWLSWGKDRWSGSWPDFETAGWGWGGPDGDRYTHELMGHWAGVELSRPSMRLDPVPREVSFGELPPQLTWTVRDEGEAGVQCFDVERLRRGSMEWQAILTCTSTTPLPFSALVSWSRYSSDRKQGGWWRIRIRPWDWAGNPGAWAETPEILFYEWKREGHIVDVRDRPVGPAWVETDNWNGPKDPLVFLQDSRRGLYTLYLADPETRRVRFHHPGYVYSRWYLSDDRPTDPPWRKGRVLVLRPWETYVRDGTFPTLSRSWKNGGDWMWWMGSGYAQLVVYTDTVTGSAWIAQQVVLPVTVTHPTLSFMAFFSGTRPDTHVFRVLVEEGMSSTTVFSTTEFASEERHIWLDMSAWAGRSFTLTFRLERPQPRSGEARLELWEIFLGPWTTPWISRTNQTPYVPSAYGSLVLTGHNFLSPTVVLSPFYNRGGITLTTFLSRTQTYLEVQVPPGVPPGVYRIRVVNADGTDAVAVEPFVSGWPVYLPASLREAP